MLVRYGPFEEVTCKLRAGGETGTLSSELCKRETEGVGCAKVLLQREPAALRKVQGD